MVVGNGTMNFAEAFREDYSLDSPLLIDPELRAYRAAGLRRGRVEALSPRMPLNALRALSSGSRQGSVQGDVWQLGGVFVIRPGGDLAYCYVSREAGDHAPPEAILESLSKDVLAVTEQPEPGLLSSVLGRVLSRVVDPTIALSFDRTGFRIHSLTFRPDDLDVDLSGRRCLVTGANSGIGYESALALADLGADVVLLCRSRERGEAAAERIREQTGNGTHLGGGDRRLAARIGAVRGRQTAGRARGRAHPQRRRASRGAARNRGWTGAHLRHPRSGPHLLTRLLRAALEKSSDARVIWVSSGGMYTRRLNVRDPNWQEREYDGVLAYAETKRSQVVLAELWAEELRGTSVVVNSMHPGWANTPSVKTSLPNFYRVTRPLLRTPAEGADSVVWLAASPRANQWTRCFFFDRAIRRTHLLPFTRESGEDRSQLWKMCEEACAVSSRSDTEP